MIPYTTLTAQTALPMVQTYPAGAPVHAPSSNSNVVSAASYSLASLLQQSGESSNSHEFFWVKDKYMLEINLRDPSTSVYIKLGSMVSDSALT